MAVHQPHRDDDVDRWLKRLRDEHEDARGYCETAKNFYRILDIALDDYRLHADTGTSLSEDVHECKEF